MRPAAAPRRPSRTAVTAVAFAIAAGVLTSDRASAGSDGSPDDAVSVDVLIPDGSPIIVDPAYEVLGEQFTAETGTTVNFVNSGGDYGAVEERIVASQVAGELPDAAIISSASIRTYVDAGLAQPFDPLMEADASFDVEATEPALMRFGRFDEQTYGLPLTASWLVMYYNADIFEAAGLDPDVPPATFSELETAARQIVESGAAPQGASFRIADDPNLWRFQSVVRSGGGALMNEDGELTLDDPALLEVVEFFARLADDDVVSSFDAPTMQESFFRGDLAMTFDASSGARGYEENANFDYRIAPYPIPDGGTRVMPAAGASIVMFTDDPAKQQGVWEAVRQLISPAGAAAYTSLQGGTLVIDAATNAARAADIAALGLDVGDIDAFAPMFQFPGRSAQEIWGILKDEVLAAWQSGKDPAEALADAQEAAESLLP